MNGRTRYPWYDRQKDDVRQINLAPQDDADSANRQSKWTSKSSPSGNTASLRGVSLFGPVLQGVGLVLLVAVLLAIAYLIARAFMRNEITETVVSRVIETSRDVDRVQALPFQLRKPTGDFLAEARRLYEAGNFSEAIIYLFSYELVELDRRHLIRLAKGKTNRQYLRETRQRPALREILERTMIGFEDVFFGHHDLTRERFEACWQQLDEFHAQLEQLERTAA